MPHHEDLPAEVNLWNEFRRVLEQSGLSRLHPSTLGFAVRPFSTRASSYLRSRKGAPLTHLKDEAK
jgi:hypothetical protein